MVEAGVQLHLPSYRDHPIQRLLDIASASESAGFQQLWVTDNLECRDPFVVLTALALKVQLKLGTAIMGQYFRSPVRMVDSTLPLAELMEGRELVIALGTGNPLTSRKVVMPRPVGFMRQTVDCLRQLLTVGQVAMADYPLIAEYFQFQPEAVVEAASSGVDQIRIFGGGNGPRGLAMAGELMDGLLFGWTTLPNERMSRLGGKIAIADGAAERAGRAATFRRVTELKISIARAHDEARQFVRDDPSCARRTLNMRRNGHTDDDYRLMGIDPRDVDKLEEVLAAEGPFGDFSEVVTDAMIDASYVAGDPTYCAERMTEIRDICVTYGFEQVIFSELGPDQVDAVRLLSENVLPVLAEVA